MHTLLLHLDGLDIEQSGHRKGCVCVQFLAIAEIMVDVKIAIGNLGCTAFENFAI